MVYAVMARLLLVRVVVITQLARIALERLGVTFLTVWVRLLLRLLTPLPRVVIPKERVISSVDGGPSGLARVIPVKCSGDDHLVELASPVMLLALLVPITAFSLIVSVVLSRWLRVDDVVTPRPEPRPNVELQEWVVDKMAEPVRDDKSE